MLFCSFLLGIYSARCISTPILHLLRDAFQPPYCICRSTQTAFCSFENAGSARVALMPAPTHKRGRHASVMTQE
jgi:hypothetical protein